MQLDCPNQGCNCLNERCFCNNSTKQFAPDIDINHTTVVPVSSFQVPQSYTLSKYGGHSSRCDLTYLLTMLINRFIVSTGYAPFFENKTFQSAVDTFGLLIFKSASAYEVLT